MGFIAGFALVMVGLYANVAQAATYRTSTDCAPLEAYSPPPDIEARAGFDAKGNSVASPDLHPSAMDIEALKHPSIVLDVPLTGYVNAEKYNADMSRMDIQLGTLKVEEQGQVTHNGNILSTGQQAVYPKECNR